MYEDAASTSRLLMFLIVIHRLTRQKLNKVNTKYISESINQNAGMNFNGFINEKRIAYAKELIASEAAQELTLEAIANESGFRSKSSFNNAFKNFTGMTPSQFMKKASH